MIEFWAVKVKSGKTINVKVESGERILRISQATLSKIKGSNKDELVKLYAELDDGSKMHMGNINSIQSTRRFQLKFERDFQLSHSRVKGSVWFVGYKAPFPKDEQSFSDGSFAGDRYDQNSSDADAGETSAGSNKKKRAGNKKTTAAKKKLKPTM